MLELVKCPDHLNEEDYCLAFQGVNLIADMRSSVPLLERAQLNAENWQIEQEQFVGLWEGKPCYAMAVSQTQTVDPMRYHLGHMMAALGRVPPEVFDLLGRGAQLLAWERDHRYCGRCGKPMQRHDSESAMYCPSCNFLCYPRIAPCAITLVTRGEEILLAQAVGFPDGMYSTLAGFVEAGESVEQCLVREVKEEVGLEVGNLRYVGSQPWGFPGQLMLGFFCDYISGDIRCAPAEIADAQWFRADNLPQIPPPQAIAGRMINEYLQSLGA